MRDCRRRRGIRLQGGVVREEGLHISFPNMQFTHAADSIPFIIFYQKHCANHFNTAMSGKIQLIQQPSREVLAPDTLPT